MEMAVIGLVVLVVVAAAVAYFTRRGQTPGATAVAKLPYRVRDSLLTPAERSFYGVLRTAAEPFGLDVFAMVRMIDVFFAPGQVEARASHNARIQQKHVDFLLCDRDRVSPVLGIELDDRSHERNDRRARDAFVDQVFRDAGLPLLHFPARTGYVVGQSGLSCPASCAASPPPRWRAARSCDRAPPRACG